MKTAKEYRIERSKISKDRMNWEIINLYPEFCSEEYEKEKKKLEEKLYEVFTSLSTQAESHA